MRAGPVSEIAAFAQALRRRGMTVTPEQASDMAEALTLVDLSKRSEVYAALRCLAVTDPGHRVPYDEEFRRLFDGRGGRDPDEGSERRAAPGAAAAPVLETISEEELEGASAETGASASENAARRDFAELDDAQLAEAKRLVMTMLWQPSDARTRRWAPESRGRRPDMRRTLHGAVGPEGDLLRVEMLRRRVKQRPLIVITDVSGSMERYADVFLVFAHSALQRLRHVEAFAFSTRLTRITDDLRRRDTRASLAAVSRSVTDWAAGTKIGEAIAEWNKTWSRRMCRGGPTALVLSDGWDCGDPDLLSSEMARLSRSVHRVIWLNPLAGRAGYEPTTRGMRAVLPHIDHLLPAASVRDLRGVVRLLESIRE